jgi:hypothetical protein
MRPLPLPGTPCAGRDVDKHAPQPPRGRIPAVPAGRGLHWSAPPRNPRPMAKPNYSFEKRQRELAKKKAKEEKRAKKQAAREPSADESAQPAEAQHGEA